MTREQGWRFLMIGRRLERAQGTATLLAETLAQAADSSAEPLILESLLRANDSVMTHRRRYRALLDPASFLEVLLLDERNPRASPFSSRSSRSCCRLCRGASQALHRSSGPFWRSGLPCASPTLRPWRPSP